MNIHQSCRSYDAIVVGGGPAGTGVATRLARDGYNVALIEKSSGRRERLCGEFLSPELVRLFDDLGVLGQVAEAGAQTIRSMRLTSVSGASAHSELPSQALGLSRATMDQVLLENARKNGVTIVDGNRVTSVSGTADSGFDVSTNVAGALRSRIVVGAFGKRSSLDGVLKRSHLGKVSPWVAFKIHCETVDVGQTIELHCFQRGYCGLSMVEDGSANACWLMHSDDLKAAGGRPATALSEHLSRNPILAERLSTESFGDASFLSAGQLTFRARGCFHGDVALVGDAAGMISPLCGDGIAMAAESAALLASSLSQWLAGRRSYDWVRADYSANWSNRFESRLAIGNAIQRLLVNEAAANRVVRLARRFPNVVARLFEATRGR